jgi:RNA polymerase sigma factor (sigma-70 family)
MKDAQVLELMRSGRYTKVAEKLYVYFPVIRKMIVKNSGTRQDAEDIYQEALIILMRKSKEDGFALSCSVNTYLYSVCRYLWNDQLKARSKKVEVDFLKVEPVLQDAQIPSAVKEEADFKLAEQAVSKLGEQCRKLLQWFYFDKLALKEIAQRLRFASEKVAKNQKYRCIEKAKEHLKTLKSISHE